MRLESCTISTPNSSSTQLSASGPSGLQVSSACECECECECVRECECACACAPFQLHSSSTCSVVSAPNASAPLTESSSILVAATQATHGVRGEARRR